MRILARAKAEAARAKRSVGSAEAETPSANFIDELHRLTGRTYPDHSVGADRARYAWRQSVVNGQLGEGGDRGKAFIDLLRRRSCVVERLRRMTTVVRNAQAKASSAAERMPAPRRNCETDIVALGPASARQRAS